MSIRTKAWFNLIKFYFHYVIFYKYLIPLVICFNLEISGNFREEIKRDLTVPESGIQINLYWLWLVFSQGKFQLVKWRTGQFNRVKWGLSKAINISLTYFNEMFLILILKDSIFSVFLFIPPEQIVFNLSSKINICSSIFWFSTRGFFKFPRLYFSTNQNSSRRHSLVPRRLRTDRSTWEPHLQRN